MDVEVAGGERKRWEAKSLERGRERKEFFSKMLPFLVT